MTKFLRLLLAGAFAAAMMSTASAQEVPSLPDYVVEAFGVPPAIPTGPLSEETETAIAQLLTHSLNQSAWQPEDRSALETLAASGDPRVAWLLSDMMRFTWRAEFGLVLTETALALTGIKLETLRHWSEVTDHLIAWDLPAYPGYLDHKRAIFTRYIDGWERIFQDGDIDWQLVSWGGVNIDNRPYDQTDAFCDCIPAVDNPEVISASQATWPADDDIVFGVEINGEARAYPRQIMEVREMVNDTLGGRDIGMPYCTLCGAAQAFFTDLPGRERPILRTSGLLSRSNKVMYDLNTYSVFDTFKGLGVTGPLRGVQLEQASVITTTWGEWKSEYPDSTVLVEALALGRDFDFRNGRDANGPIFPVGDVDPRLSVQDDVIGVIAASGTPIAFERGKSLLALKAGQEVTFENVRLVLSAGGLKAVDANGSELGSHEAFWFAWSQFHPETAVWGN